MCILLGRYVNVLEESCFPHHEDDFPPPFWMLALGIKLPFFAKSSRVISSASRNLEFFGLTRPSFLKAIR